MRLVRQSGVKAQGVFGSVWLVQIVKLGAEFQIRVHKEILQRIEARSLAARGIEPD